MANSTKQEVEILWTGGFDSTFRIVELSKCNVIIQPYYLSDKRKSENYELNAIKEITELLQKHPNTQAKFLAPIIIDSSERIDDSKITGAYNRVLENNFFGAQYDWLARFAKLHQGLELLIHVDDKATAVIKKHGVLKKIYDSATGGSTYILDVDNSEEDIVTLFSNYRLPVINMTKLEMKERYISDGYKDVMDKTWFCFTPINGKPCGVCNPCKYTIEEGMTERFTRGALIRYSLNPIIRNRFTRKLKKTFLQTIQLIRSDR